jgi:hypothetical protein
MCSGCSGDYYSDFSDQNGLSGEDDWIEFHYGNRVEGSQWAAESAVVQDAPHNFLRAETGEDCEFFVSMTDITEIRVFRADGRLRRDIENTGAPWANNARVRQRLQSVSAKRYRTVAGARLLLLPDGNALGIEFSSFVFGVLIAALMGMWVLAR